MANQSNDFNTPPELLEPIREFWGGTIDLDPCSNTNSMVHAKQAWSLPFNGLSAPWLGNTFINPPFAPYYLSSNGAQCLTPKEYADSCLSGFTRYTIKDWVRKAYVDYTKGLGDKICLVPARGMGNSLWQDIILPNFSAVCFLAKRYPFWENGEPCKGPDGTVNPPQFDCALPYFGKEPKRFREHFSKYGFCLVGEQ